MKKGNKNSQNIFRILTAVLVAAAMCCALCACGEEGSTEETVVITVPAQDQSTDAKAENGQKAEGTEDGESAAKEAGSQYEAIYNECNAEMEKATKEYVADLESKVDSLSKNKLYDETQAKMDALEKVYDAGKDKMIEAMLASTEDDAREYDKWFSKMTESYSELCREITTVYTDAF